MMKLKNRHIQMIAIGGAIGTGLFYGAAKSIQLTGPSILLSYLIGGVMMYVIMRALGEMTVHSPNSGAFSHYAYQYVGDYLGFLSGWFAWFEYTIVCMLEVTVVASFLDYWIPGVPHWVSIASILGLFFLINMMQVRLFGEFEFWFAGIKVATIVLMMAFSSYLIFFHADTHTQALENIRSTVSHNLFANGMEGFLFSMVLVVFSFGGVQFLGIAAADAEDPDRTVPRAVNGVIIRILVFYVGTLLAILCLYPWQKLHTDVSPFVDVFDKVGFHFAAQIMSIVVITAALSAFNSCLYAAARMLANLARHQSAPASLARTDKHNVPRNAVIATSIVIALTVLLNYLVPEKAIAYLIAVTTTSIIITWTTILICHAGFRRETAGDAIKYKLPFFPYANWMAFGLLAAVVIIMLFMQDMKMAVYLMPLWIGMVTVLYFAIRSGRA
ncbi:Aromatic amino acid transport protein AroP [Aquicella siphonis]|uniref:Aromatic amino acid transport protein AroP n=1 Tax=Aquicella siphonis TaxID=254247 RepID=A0A5E4PGB1_9COXI|nr:amino acid permease [Aquicella siphonis]VVC75502.1 Aromatic amino acid transport protein AroP [Aquicella siphonis]